jgi:hypothetical protein
MRSFTSIVAHLTIAHCHPKRLDHVLKACGDRLLPEAQKGMGYRGSYLLVNRESSQLIAFSLWDTAADALAFQESAPCQSELTGMGSCLARPASFELYDVSAQA